MKKLITALLALALLLACLPALGESAGTAYTFDDVGMKLDFRDVIDASPYYVYLSDVGILQREPFVAALALNMAALPTDDAMDDTSANDDDFDEETLSVILQSADGLNAELAYVIVTDAGDPDAVFQRLFGLSIAESGAVGFGQVGAYRYFAVPQPGFTEPEDVEAYQAYGMEPEAVRAAFLELGETGDNIRASFFERLKTAELYAPVDPKAGLVGQVISFETTDVDGNPVSSADLFKNNKITMLNAWGTWCSACVGEMKELTEIHTRLQAKGCGIVGLEWEQRPVADMADEIHAFLETRGVNYPNVIFPEDAPILRDIYAFPTTYFVDSEGRILTVPIEGADVASYEATVDRLLNGTEMNLATTAGAVKNDSGKYHVIVLDADSQPVEGAVIQLCDETTCSFQPTGADGVATFAVTEQKVYEVHVLMAPEGFKPDPEVYKTLDTFSDVRIVLEKAE